MHAKNLKSIMLFIDTGTRSYSVSLYRHTFGLHYNHCLFILYRQNLYSRPIKWWGMHYQCNIDWRLELGCGEISYGFEVMVNGARKGVLDSTTPYKHCWSSMYSSRVKHSITSVIPIFMRLTIKNQLIHRCSPTFTPVK